MKIIPLNTVYKDIFFPGTGTDSQIFMPAITLNEFSHFKCGHCGQEYSLNGFREACFLYGFFNLEGEKTGYIGTTCSNKECHKNITLHGDKELYVRLREDILGGDFININDILFQPIYQYYTNIIYDPNQLEEISNFHLPFFPRIPGTDDRKELYYDDLQNYIKDHNLSDSKYFSTFQTNKIISDNNIISIWWFTKDQIEQCISIENKKNIRIFPRSIPYDELHKEIDHYLLEYRPKSILQKNKHTTEESTFIPMNQEKQLLNKKVKFLHLLTFKPIPKVENGIIHYHDTNFSKTALDFDRFYKGTELEIKHLDYLKIENEISGNIHTEHMQEMLERLDLDFLEEYESLCKKIDFSFDKVWQLKDKYLYQIYTSCKAGFSAKKKKRKLRPDQLAKKECRFWAETFWAQDPSITIREMSEKQELKAACDNVYTDRTRSRWICDLAPNRKGGRRPNKKS